MTRHRWFLLVWALLLAASAQAQRAPARLTLDEAVTQALQHNTRIRVVRSRLAESEAHRRAVKTGYFPVLTTSASLVHNTAQQEIVFPRGALGTYPEVGPLPGADLAIDQGGQTFKYATTSVVQPLTSLLDVRAALRIAGDGERIAAAEVRQAEAEVALGVEQLYLELLSVRHQRRALELRLAADEAQLAHHKQAIASQTKLAMVALEGEVSALDSRLELLALDDQIADLTARLREETGLDGVADLELVRPPLRALPDSLDLTELLAGGLAASPEVVVASETVVKARHGLAAARIDYLPDVSLYAEHVFQDAVPFMAKHNVIFGLSAEWTLFDFGRRKAALQERRAALGTAEENLAGVQRRLATDIEQAHRKVLRSFRAVTLAQQALQLRQEAMRVRSDQVELGFILASDRAESEADLAAAEAGVLAAQLKYQLSLAELDRLAGRLRRP